MSDKYRIPFVNTSRTVPYDSDRALAGVLAKRRVHRGVLLRNVAIGSAVFLLLFALVGFFLVPPIAKYYLAKQLSEQLERKVAIQDIDVNPFVISTRVRGLSISERNSSQTFASFRELALNLQWRSIIRLAPVLNHIELTEPYVHIVRNADGTTYNFSDLIAKFSKPAAQTETPSQPARFSLNNLRLVNGRIVFDDVPKGAQHTVSEMNVAIPFISNLPDMVDEYVQPSFSARVNGTPVALAGSTKPFKDTLETAIDLNVAQLDLPRYMEYVPVKLGFRVASGSLQTKLNVSFVRSQRALLLLVRGSAGLEKLSLTQLNGEPLLSLAALSVPVTQMDVFGSKYDFGSIVLLSPEVFVERAADGSVNWMALRPQTANAAAPAAGAQRPPVQLSIAEIAIHDGRVHVKDRVPAKGFSTDLSEIEASLKQFALPQSAPAQAELAFKTKLDENVKLSSSLLLDPLSVEGTLQIDKMRLKNYEPYYADLILYRLEDGVADLSTRYSFASTQEGPRTRLSEFNLGLTSVRMRKPGEPEDFLRAKTAKIADAQVDVNQFVLTVGQFTTSNGLLNIVREPDGALNATRILPASKEARASARQATPWQITLNKVEFDKWRMAYTDLATKEPVKIVADDVRLNASGLSNQKNRKAQISLQAKLNDTGAVKVKGPVVLNPLATELDLQLDKLGLVPLQPYFTDLVNILLSSGDASLKGNVKLAIGTDGALSAAYAGEANLTDFASVDKAKSEDLLKWRSLFLGGIAYNHAPMTLEVGEVALTDFYSRIILFADGRMNLQDIVAKSKAPGDAAAASGDRPKPPPADASARAAQAAPATPPPPIRIGKVTLQGGDINFTDLFIKPNYSADLSEIGGSVIGLSSQLDTTADVDLRGRFAKTAPVQIKGKINPLVQNLVLDLKADVRDIELGPFSAYSGKYVGYAIDKGKMSFDVAYKVVDRKLEASNKLVLDQLTFGDKVESPQATKLPVLLAVSLLKDRNGVIDVNLPISGSLDDPKFSVGGIIWRVILNLLEKAVTAPFALIGNLFGGSGGGEELAYVEFDYGSAALAAPGRDKLAKLQTALIERPALKLDITGRADRQQDREGLRQSRFEQQIKAQKLKDMVKRGEAVRSVDEVKVEPTEYEKYLTRAYKDAKFAKPRNALGFAKDLPADEMRKLMLTNTQVSDDDIIQLANQRAQVAKDAITRDGKVPLERVFLLAAKFEPGKAENKLKLSRVDFSLK